MQHIHKTLYSLQTVYPPLRHLVVTSIHRAKKKGLIVYRNQVAKSPTGAGAAAGCGCGDGGAGAAAGCGCGDGGAAGACACC